MNFLQYELSNDGLRAASINVISRIYSTTTNQPALIQALDTLLTSTARCAQTNVDLITHCYATLIPIYATLLELMATATAGATIAGTKSSAQRLFSNQTFNLNSRTTLVINKELARGAFGVVYTGTYNSHPIIVKIPMVTHSTATGTAIALNTYNFIRENFIHILLQSFQTQFSELAGKQLPAFVPAVHMMCKIQANDDAVPCVVMEKLTGDGYAFIKTKRTTMEIIDMISQIAQALYYLQKYSGFTHRDLHLGNIMFSNRQQPVNVDCNIVDEQFEFAVPQSTTQWYLIDFGLACLRFKCCDMPLAALALTEDPTTGHYYPVNSQAVSKCENEGFDMRILLRSLLEWYPQTDAMLSAYLAQKFEPEATARSFPDFYKDYTSDYPAFSPIQVLNDMAALTRVLPAKNVKTVTPTIIKKKSAAALRSRVKKKSTNSFTVRRSKRVPQIKT